MTDNQMWWAFPHRDNTKYHHGMTLRDYFAAKAMAALIGDGGYDSRNNDLAKGAYSVADAMLRAREK